MGPSKNTSKLPLIIKANSIEVIAKVLPANFLVNRALNNDTNRIIQAKKTKYPNLAKMVK